MSCINQNSSEFQTLLRQTGLSPSVLASKIATFQNTNQTDEYPSLSQLLTGSSNQNINWSSYSGYIEESIRSTSKIEKPTSYNFDAEFIESNKPFAKSSKKIKGVGEIIELKKSNLNRIENSLVKLYSSINNKTVTNITEATRTQKQLEQYKEILEEEIENLSKQRKTNINKITPYINTEISYAKELIKSGNHFDIQNAKQIIFLLKEMGSFADLDNHPLFFRNEIINSKGKYILPKDTIEQLRQWKNEAIALEEELYHQMKNNLQNFMDSNEVLDMAKKNMGENYLSQMETGMKDIHIFDAYFFGVGQSFFNKDHWISSVVSSMLWESMTKQTAKSNAISEKINELSHESLKILKGMGETLKRYGIDSDAPVFEAFRKYTENGQRTSYLVQKYSDKWDNFYNSMTKGFKTEMSDIFLERIPDVNVRMDKLKELAKRRSEKLQETTEWFNIQFVPEIVELINNTDKYEDFRPYLSNDDNINQEFKQKIVDLVGIKHYNKLVEKQIKEFEQFYQNRDVEFSVNEIGESINKRSSLSMDEWDALYSPFTNPYSVLESGEGIYTSSLKWQTLIPKRITTNNENTNFYDNRYEDIIESNNTLSELYDTIVEGLDFIYNSLDFEGQKQIQDPLFIPEQNKSLVEILHESMSFQNKKNSLFKNFWDYIRSKWSANPTNNYSTLKIDQITGEPSYRIDQSFLRNNRRKFDQMFQINKRKFEAVYKSHNKKTTTDDLGISHTVGKELNITKNTIIDIKTLSDISINLLNEFTNVQWTREQWVKKYGNNIPVGKILYESSQHLVAAEVSFDLPKIMNIYLRMAAENAARHEILPEATMLKEKYDQLKNTQDPETQKTNDLRANAVKKFGWWFETQVLNYNHVTKGLWIKHRDKIESNDPEGNKKIILGKLIPKKTYNSFEKELIKDIDKFIDLKQLNKDDKDALIQLKENMGSNISGTQLFDSLLTFVRAKALGWNISSSMTNIIAGQLSNATIASSGTYFPPQNIHLCTFNDLVGASIRSKIDKSKVDPKMKLYITLFKKFNIKQDASNELQKATYKSPLSGTLQEKLSPYYGIARGEDFNQIPLFVSLLETKKVKDKNGNEVSVIEALEAFDIVDKDGKTQGWDTRLKEEFRTEENIENWENLSGKDTAMFANQIEQLIILGHGDFSNYSGMMIKSNALGRMFMMFKTWLPMELHKRFSAEQYHMRLGVVQKGRYRSHTAASGAVQGAVVGSWFGGPIGIIGGGLIGYSIGRWFNGSQASVRGKELTPKNNIIDHLSEMLIIAQYLSKKILSFAVNPITKLTTGKRVIDAEQVYINGEWKSLDSVLGRNDTFSEIDLQNWKSNMQEISMVLTYMGLILIAKMFTYDEDDDDDSLRRKAHNAVINKLMQAANECTMYLTPLSENGVVKTAWNIGIMSFFENVNKTVNAFVDLTQGEDMYLSGPNVGNSKLATSINRTFVPGIFNSISSQIIADKETDFFDLAGLNSLTKRQFEETPIDSWFKSDKTKEDIKIKQKRIRYKKELEKNTNLSEKEIKKRVDKKYPTLAQQEQKKKKK